MGRFSDTSPSWWHHLSSWYLCIRYLTFGGPPALCLWSPTVLMHQKLKAVPSFCFYKNSPLLQGICHPSMEDGKGQREAAFLSPIFINKQLEIWRLASPIILIAVDLVSSCWAPLVSSLGKTEEHNTLCPNPPLPMRKLNQLGKTIMCKDITE